MTLTRGEKIRLTRIKNIKKEFGNITDEQADLIRIQRIKDHASIGGKNGTGHSFGHGADPVATGRKGALKRWKNERARKV